VISVHLSGRARVHRGSGKGGRGIGSQARDVRIGSISANARPSSSWARETRVLPSPRPDSPRLSPLFRFDQSFDRTIGGHRGSSVQTPGAQRAQVPECTTIAFRCAPFTRYARTTENPGVGSSILPLSTISLNADAHFAVAAPQGARRAGSRLGLNLGVLCGSAPGSRGRDVSDPRR
jgi:hypothetical protein